MLHGLRLNLALIRTQGPSIAGLDLLLWYSFDPSTREIKFCNNPSILLLCCNVSSPDTTRVRTIGAKAAFLVNYSEAGAIIYNQRAQEENCTFFSGRNEAPIVRHSDRPRRQDASGRHPKRTPSDKPSSSDASSDENHRIYFSQGRTRRSPALTNTPSI